MLARAIRNGLFIEAYGPYALVYVAAASPLVLSLFVPAYTLLAARLGARRVTIADAALLQPQRRCCCGTPSAIEPTPRADRASSTSG